MKQNKIYIYGKHAVMEAILNAPQVLTGIFLAPGGDDMELKNAAAKASISVSMMKTGRGAKGVADSETHQGVIGRVSLDRLMKPYGEFINSLEIDSNPALVILGEVQDPHNVGAIIRSAAAFGISGVLIPQRNQAPVTGAVVKVSAGMAFHIPLVGIGNVNDTIRDLKKRGFWIYGLDGSAKQTVSQESYDNPSVFVFGNESQGIRQKTVELCDALVSIPINPKCESLNVAASAAVTLYAWSGSRQ